MILTAHQPVYLPWLGLFAKIAQADEFVVFDCCPKEDSGFENRNRILSPVGEQWLTVPIRHHRLEPLSEIRIVKDQPWQRKHWRAIELAYQRAPFWKQYRESLEWMYREQHWELLSGLNVAQLKVLLDILGLERNLILASSLGLQGKKSDLVLDMCKRMGATEYIFGEKGREYADIAAFEREGIRVRFQEYKHPTYPQLNRGFVSHLSVIDLIFNVGGERALQILRNA